MVGIISWSIIRDCILNVKKNLPDLRFLYNYNSGQQPQFDESKNRKIGGKGLKEHTVGLLAVTSCT